MIIINFSYSVQTTPITTPSLDLKQTVDNLNSSLDEAHTTLQDVNASLLEVQSSLEETQAVLLEKEELLQLQQTELEEKALHLDTASKNVGCSQSGGKVFFLQARELNGCCV